MRGMAPTLHAAVCAWILCLYAGGARGIRVKFGTNDGPIVPPAPTPSVAPVPPFRTPAPVWEDRRDDLPDPNANWRPLFVPSPRYTQVNYNPLPLLPIQPPVQSSAQRFVSSYLPKRTASDAAPAQPPTQYIQANQAAQAAPATHKQQGAQLSSQSVPGIGIRYFVPLYERVLPQSKEQTDKSEDSQQNRLDNDEVSQAGPGAAASGHDASLHYEKEFARRPRFTLEGSHNAVPAYYWPAFPYRHQ